MRDKESKYISSKFLETQHRKAKEKGYEVIKIGSEGTELRCSKGHTIKLSGYIGDSTKCNICEGTRMDLDKMNTFLYDNGLQLNECEENVMSEDRHGNLVVKAARRLEVLCEKEHPWKVSISEIRKGKTCPTCKGTNHSSGFSRAEDIIDRVLKYLDVLAIRQFQTTEDYEGLYLDFYLPQVNIIIEHDGAHHKYGFTSRGENLEEIKRKDRLKDMFALDKGIKMYRISSESYAGKEVIYDLLCILEDNGLEVDFDSPVYDDILRDAYNYTHERYGWISYEEIKHIADLRKEYSLIEVSKKVGKSDAVVSRYFKGVYGMNLEDYKKYDGSLARKRKSTKIFGKT